MKSPLLLVVFTTFFMVDGCRHRDIIDPNPGDPTKISLISDKDLKLWMKFDGSLEEKSKYHHSASASDISYSSDRFGKSGSSLKIEGTNSSFVEVNHNNNLVQGADQDVSASAWIKWPDVEGAVGINGLDQPQYAGIVVKARDYDHGGFRGWQVTIGQGKYLNIQYGELNTYVDATCYDKALDDGLWHHVVVVFERSTQHLKFYIDNKLLLNQSSPVLSMNVDNVAPIRIGIERNTVRPFKGKIDDVRVYYRSLSAVDVNALYNEGK